MHAQMGNSAVSEINDGLAVMKRDLGKEADEEIKRNTVSPAQMHVPAYQPGRFGEGIPASIANLPPNATGADIARAAHEAAKDSPNYHAAFAAEANRRLKRDGGVTNAVRKAVSYARKRTAEAKAWQAEFDRRKPIQRAFEEKAGKRVGSAILDCKSGYFLMLDAKSLVDITQPPNAGFEGDFNRVRQTQPPAWQSMDYSHGLFGIAHPGWYIIHMYQCIKMPNGAYPPPHSMWEMELTAHRFKPQLDPNAGQFCVQFESGVMMACDPGMFDKGHRFGAPMGMFGEAKRAVDDIARNPNPPCGIRPSAMLPGMFYFHVPMNGFYEFVVRQRNSPQGPRFFLCCETSAKHYLMDGVEGGSDADDEEDDKTHTKSK